MRMPAPRKRRALWCACVRAACSVVVVVVVVVTVTARAKASWEPEGTEVRKYGWACKQYCASYRGFIS